MRGADLAIIANTINVAVFSLMTKPEIKSAVETIFQVKVDAVRTANFLGKMARRGRFEGRKPAWKKAYVTLKKGEKPVDYGEAI